MLDHEVQVFSLLEFTNSKLNFPPGRSRNLYGSGYLLERVTLLSLGVLLRTSRHA